MNKEGMGRTCDCSDAPPAGTIVSAPTAAGRVECGTTVISGADKQITFNVDVGNDSGTVTVAYQMYSTPDRIEAKYEGQSKLDTGMVTGSQSADFSFSGNSEFIQVTVFAPSSETAWDFTVSCA